MLTVFTATFLGEEDKIGLGTVLETISDAIHIQPSQKMISKKHRMTVQVFF